MLNLFLNISAIDQSADLSPNYFSSSLPSPHWAEFDSLYGPDSKPGSGHVVRSKIADISTYSMFFEVKKVILLN
jgi:hypothetical protein